MRKTNVTIANFDGLQAMFSTVGEVINSYTENALLLFKYSTTPIESEDEVIERSEVMDFLMDMAKHEDDVALVYAHAISDRIHEFESEFLELPKVSSVEMLKGLMEARALKQSDLKHIAPQSVISEILKGKRTINLKQAKSLSEYFNVPLEDFVD